MAEYERQTARKCTIKQLLQGNFIEQDGWDPNYVETVVGDISRCNLMGIIVSHDESSITIDDSTSTVTVRTFGEVDLSPFEVGDAVVVIGRPRLYNDALYIAGEIVQRTDEDWLAYRKAEIERLPTRELPEREEEPQTTEESTTTTDEADVPELTERILERIDKLDDGDGADVDEVIEDIDGAEERVNALMEEGEVFEITPGKVKVLE